MVGFQIISEEGCRRCSTGSSGCCIAPEGGLPSTPALEWPVPLGSPVLEEPVHFHQGTLAPAQLRCCSPVIALQECSPALVCSPHCCRAVKRKDQMVLEAWLRGMRPGRMQKGCCMRGREDCIPLRGCSSLRDRRCTWIGRGRIVVVGRRVSVGIIRRRDADWHGAS